MVVQKIGYKGIIRRFVRQTSAKLPIPSEDFLDIADLFLSDINDSALNNACGASSALISAAYSLNPDILKTAQSSIVKRMRETARTILARGPHNIIGRLKSGYKSNSQLSYGQETAAACDTLVALAIAAHTYKANKKISQMLTGDLNRYVSQLCVDRRTAFYWYEKLWPHHNDFEIMLARKRVQELVENELKGFSSAPVT